MSDTTRPRPQTPLLPPLMTLLMVDPRTRRLVRRPLMSLGGMASGVELSLGRGGSAPRSAAGGDHEACGAQRQDLALLQAKHVP